MAKIEIGKRVRVVKLDGGDTCYGIQVGDEGTVVAIDGAIGVRMDVYDGRLFNCFGMCEDGHGKWFEECQLELIENKASPLVSITSLENLSFIMGAVVTSNLPQGVKEDIGKIIDSIETEK